MKIKEVENLLSVSRSNIRFYEKEGLLTPERANNNYRDYSEQDVAKLKKILVLRKLGFTVEEISLMQKGDLSFTDAAGENIARLEKEIAALRGALEFTKTLSEKQPSFEALDQESLWDEIIQSEHDGKKFADICKDYLMFELNMFDTMWKYIFFHNFKKSRKRHGILIACCILLLICILRGIGKVVFWHGTFLDGFLYPIILFAACSVVVLPIYILSKKNPKVASVISMIFIILGVSVIVFCILAIFYGVFRLILS